MITLIQMIQQALDKKAEIFLKEIQCLQPFTFPTKYTSKAKMARGRVLANKQEKTLKFKAHRAYAIWSDFEDESLRTSFKIHEKSIEAIAKLHNRTPSAIHSRLKKLKLITY